MTKCPTVNSEVWFLAPHLYCSQNKFYQQESVMHYSFLITKHLEFLSLVQAYPMVILGQCYTCSAISMRKY